MKHLILIFALLMIISCTGLEPKSTEVVIKHVVMEAPDGTEVKIEIDPQPKIAQSMEVQNPKGCLSANSFLAGDKAFTKIYSGLSVSDVTRLWNDLIWLENETDIRIVELFINSPGGDAFSGLALADQIERAIKRGFTINAHASGIIASAAVPVFTVCSTRTAASGTIFMVHEAALWKWPGRETASDIRSQNELMGLLRDRYISKLVDRSKLNKQEWEAMERKTSWFSAEQAMKYGIVDKIE